MGIPARQGACPRSVVLSTKDVISVALTQEQVSGLAIVRKHEDGHGEIALIIFN